MRDSVLMKLVPAKKFGTAPRPALLLLFAVFVLIAACGKQTPVGTATPLTIDTTVPTVPPSVSERAEVASVFAEEIALISNGDWAAIYDRCTVDLRNRRDLETFIEQAEANFFRQGYSYDGFEARNIVVTTEPRDRVSVTYDAYENGEFIRTVTPDGGAFVLVRGEWIDDGINCRTSNRPAILP
ncbi:MAG: hypothetical protein IIB26_00795 [Chloroflexi bacterium]|nr:hypothetical protein [Chloroflexota bacterium]